MNAPGRRWYHDLTRYHWFVLVVAALGWLFDTMDQQLFLLARVPAIKELVVAKDQPPASLAAEVPPLSPEEKAARGQQLLRTYSTLATSIFLIGWATGGIAFGILGDRVGRAKTMMWTILLYSLCTGLSAFSVGFWDFAFYRFLTGLGVGGEFAVGVALVAEVMPDHVRPFALGLLQALSAIGNISAALINMGVGHLEATGALAHATLGGDTPIHGWRWMFVVGTLPALLAVVIRRRLKEPERWQAKVGTSASAVRAGSYAEMFSHPTWRRHALLGLLLAFAGVVGLWAIGFFSFDLLDSVFRAELAGENLPKNVLDGRVSVWKGVASIVQNVGGFLGIWAFSRITHVWGRKPTFALFFVAAAVCTAGVFWKINSFADAMWMLPLMGFCQLALFGGYAIYFPELFPTRLRSTGTSFCYNVGRFAAAVGPPALALLSNRVYSGFADPLPLRYAAMTMCSVFLLGLVALPFMPETKGQPLPE